MATRKIVICYDIYDLLKMGRSDPDQITLSCQSVKPGKYIEIKRFDPVEEFAKIGGSLVSEKSGAELILG